MNRIDLRTIPETGQHHRFRIDPDDRLPVEKGEDIVVPAGPMHFEADIQRAGRKFILNGHLTGRTRVRCDRCLKLFERDVDARFRTFLVLTKDMDTEAEIELEDQELEVEFTPGDEIDVLDLVHEQLLLEQPMKNLCSESCKGLCAGCGADLNQGACGCASDQGHPAFRKLEELKFKGEQD